MVACVRMSAYSVRVLIRVTAHNTQWMIHLDLYWLCRQSVGYPPPLAILRRYVVHLLRFYIWVIESTQKSKALDCVSKTLSLSTEPLFNDDETCIPKKSHFENKLPKQINPLFETTYNWNAEKDGSSMFGRGSNRRHVSKAWTWDWLWRENM